MASWTLETIAWDRFDASKVDPEILLPAAEYLMALFMENE